MIEIYITCLLQILSFPSSFRRFEMKNFLRRPPMVVDNISELVAPQECLSFLRARRKHLCWNLSFKKVADLKVCNFIKKKPQLFSCEYRKIFTNNLFIEHVRWLLLIVLPQYSKVSLDVCSLILPLRVLYFNAKLLYK